MRRATWIAGLAAGAMGLLIGLFTASSITYAPAEHWERYSGRKSQNPVSQLGREPSGIERDFTASLQRARERRRDHARTLDQVGRRLYILGLVSTDKAPATWGWLKWDRYDLLLDLNAHILPEDVPGLLERCRAAGPELNPGQWAFLTEVVCKEAGKTTLGLAEITAMPDGGMRQKMLQAYLAELASRDPFAALAIVQDKALTADLEHFYGNHFAKAAELDPARALAAAGKMGTPGLRRQAYRDILDNVATRQGIEQALRMADKLRPAKLRKETRRELLVTDANRSPEAREAALNRLMEPGMKGKERDATIAGILERGDPEASLAWLDEHAAALQLKENRPPNYMGDQEEPDLSEMRWKIMDRFAETNPDQALGLALAQTDPSVRTAYLSPVMDMLARGDPRRAAEVSATLPPEEQAQLRHSLVFYWAQNDPAGAANYVESLANTPGTDDAMKSLIESWTYVDAPGASVWLEQQPASAKKDRAVATLVERVKWEDPEGAGAWTFQIIDATERAKVQRDLVISAWDRKPDDARAWVKANATILGEEQASTLLQAIDNERIGR